MLANASTLARSTHASNPSSSGELGARVLRQLFTNVTCAAEYGSGVMVRSKWQEMEVLMKRLLMQALRVPRSTGGLPVECVFGEFGIMSFDARAAMHTVRVWDAIMTRPADSLPRLAWDELVAECEARGNPPYTLVARVKEVLQSVGKLDRFGVGLPVDPDTPTGYEAGCSPKELLQRREGGAWRARCAIAPSLRGYETVRSEWPRYEEYLEHPDWEVNLVRWRLRTGFAAVSEYLGRRHGIPLAERTCQCPGCDHPGDVESVKHMLLVCSHWADRRAALEASILNHPGLSLQLKAMLGPITASPDKWWRALMCASLPDLGNEYSEPVAVLTKRVSSRAWDPTVTQDDVDRARRSLQDRKTIMWVTGRQLRAWYLERAQMSGYEGV